LLGYRVAISQHYTPENQLNVVRRMEIGGRYGRRPTRLQYFMAQSGRTIGIQMAWRLFQNWTVERL